MYDGMGGNTKPDVFPEPLPRHIKKSVKKRTNTLSKVEKQKQKIDRFLEVLIGLRDMKSIFQCSVFQEIDLFV